MNDFNNNVSNPYSITFSHSQLHHLSITLFVEELKYLSENLNIPNLKGPSLLSIYDDRIIMKPTCFKYTNTDEYNFQPCGFHQTIKLKFIY